MIIDDVKPWMLVGLPVIVLLSSFVLAALKRSASVITAFGAVGIAACLVVSLPEIQTLKLGPLQASMRDAISEATATINQLRSLAATLVDPILGSLEASGRFKGPGQRQDAWSNKETIVADMKKLGLNEDQLKQVTTQFNYYVRADLLFDLYNDVVGENPDFKTRTEVMSCMHMQFQNGFLVPEDDNIFDVEKCLAGHGYLSASAADDIEDVKTFDVSHTLRRPQIYFGRAK